MMDDAMTGIVVVKSPLRSDDVAGSRRSVFLAGSIEMGQALDWQAELQGILAKRMSEVGALISIFNPRRDDWDSSWKQEITDERFKEQVEWELEYLESADVIALVLKAGTMSPISLLELGLFVKSGKLLVYCEAGFWRKGNVQVVCGRYGVELFEDWSRFEDELVRRLQG